MWFEEIKACVPTLEAARRYGLQIDRYGMACCPFHADRTPSLKLDRRFHCFGCLVDGDVIDFTARLFDLSPYEAAQKLAADFGIRPAVGPQMRQGKYEHKKSSQKRAEISWVRMLFSRYLIFLREQRNACEPTNAEESIADRFIWVCDELMKASYCHDRLLSEPEEEILGIIKENRQWIKRIECVLAENGRLPELLNCRTLKERAAA